MLDHSLWKLSLKFAFATAIAIALAGCGTTHYSTINFAWTSDDHLAPSERFVSPKSSLKDTRDILLRWLSEQGAEVVRSDDNFRHAIKMNGDAERNFRAAQAIIKAEWDAYDRNQVRDWPAGQFAELQQLSRSVVTSVPAATSGYEIVAKMNERSDSAQTLEVDGDTRTNVYNPGFTAQQGLNKIYVPGHVMSFSVPTYKSVLKVQTFYSIISFFVFHDQGQTRVYAKGIPVDQVSSVGAAYGNSTGHAWWPKITGREEADSIRAAYEYLRQIDAKSP